MINDIENEVENKKSTTQMRHNYTKAKAWTQIY